MFPVSSKSARSHVTAQRQGEGVGFYLRAERISSDEDKAKVECFIGKTADMGDGIRLVEATVKTAMSWASG